MKSFTRVLFSDLDGTLVHFHHEIAAFAQVQSVPGRGPAEPNVLYTDVASGEQRLCFTLPSSTAGPAYVSLRTHELVRRLRTQGVLFVIVTAGRKSTLLARIPMLPIADVYVGELGGRILLNQRSALLFPEANSTVPVAPPPASCLALDEEWSSQLSAVAGPLDSEVPPADRPGALWEVFRQLKAHGLTPDGNSYWGCFRVDATKSEQLTPHEAEAVLHQTCAALPPSVTSASNLGKVDFHPSCSGKGNAVRYLLKKFGVAQSDAFALFDDDNDLPMALAVGRGFVVRALTTSVEEAVQAHPGWMVASKKGVLATEEMLEALLALVSGP
eukprot:GGOE01037261.1.p1 GENE.GGOE01037261.1~~GGOE01037261.1.p1  ORF type:complete len:329 (-),score=73.41 GGOE01037261.1:234-1220(-)